MISRMVSHWTGRRAIWGASLVLGLVGCVPSGEDSHALIIATPWPPAARAACDALQQVDGSARPITWVELGSHRWLDACDRRGGIDLILGGPVRKFQALADSGLLEPIEARDPVSWREVDCPRIASAALRPEEAGRADPRDDFAALARAQATLSARGWTKGYEILVRHPVPWIPGTERTQPDRPPHREGVALLRSGRHPDQARRFLAMLTRQGRIGPGPPDAALAARTEDLLADLLGAALVDARNERRDAQVALEANQHPQIAEVAVGDAPPWPPASVTKLRVEPGRGALADALIEQITPDPAAREWLRASWQEPRHRIDLDLLRAVAQAEGGRLVREPRFRAWLRGEWTAWTQQLYRRVARLAGGYRPS